MKPWLLREEIHGLALAPYLEVKFPVADYNPLLHTSIGEHQRDITAGVHQKISFTRLLWWQWQNKLYYILRDEEPEDRIGWKSELQASLPGGFLASVHVSYQETLSDVDLGNPQANLLNLNIDTWAAGTKLGIAFLKIYAEIGYSRTLWSRNSVIADHFSAHIGTWWEPSRPESLR